MLGGASCDAPEETAYELAAELRSLADWLVLDDIDVAPRGDLAAELTFAVNAAISRSA